MKPRIEPYDEEMREVVIARVVAGESHRSIAMDLGIARTTVRRWARASNAQAERTQAEVTRYVDQGR